MAKPLSKLALKLILTSLKVSICRNYFWVKIGKFIRIGKSFFYSKNYNSKNTNAFGHFPLFRVYCKFHNLEFQSFDNSQEQELLFFVRSFYNKTWEWTKQYEDEYIESGDEENRTLCMHTMHIVYICFVSL